MKKLPILIIFSLLFSVPTWAQIWNPLSDTLNGFVAFGVNIGTPNNPSEEALLGGSFTESQNGVFSPVVVKYSNSTGQFSSVSGFDQTTDKVVGFFKRNGSWYAFGYFKKNGLHYGAMKFNVTNSIATEEPQFQFKGSFASGAKIESIGVDTNNNDVIFYGNALARMGPGTGVNLQSVKVGKITLTGTVTALGSLTPTHATENPAILTIGWKNSFWVILGNFDMLGSTSVNDCGTWDGNSVTAINTNTDSDVRCSGYSNDYFGWNGMNTTSGITSPGGLRLNNGVLEGLNGGWNIAAKYVLQHNNHVWFTGAKQATGSRLATFDVLTSSWTNRQTNLLTVDNDSIILNGIINFPGDSLICFGNFNSINSDIPGGLAVGKVTSIPLPVELTSFTGRLINGKVFLQWHAETQAKNKGFKVQRSSDKLFWTDLAFVEGNGTTFIPHDYSYWDNKPLEGTSYYRLIQIDEDNKSNVSPMVVIETLITGVTVSPNPTSGNLVIEFESLREVAALFNLIDVEGSIVSKTQTETVKGLNNTSLDLSNINAGNYTLQIIAGNQLFTAQVIVSK